MQKKTSLFQKKSKNHHKKQQGEEKLILLQERDYFCIKNETYFNNLKKKCLKFTQNILSTCQKKYHYGKNFKLLKCFKQDLKIK